MSYTAHKIHNHLFQGGWPPPGNELAKAGIDVLVLCAADNQAKEVYEGVKVICAPGDDDTRPERLARFINCWTEAAAQVANYVRDGKNVLVTCVAGHNRAGLVTAMALYYLTGWSGAKCVAHVQKRRPYALNNDLFVKYIEETFL
jgi:protein-tyrosine phosphatase